MTTADHYLPKPTYDELVEKLRVLEADKFTGRIERHQIVELLGEIGGIWPATVLRYGDSNLEDQREATVEQ